MASLGQQAVGGIVKLKVNGTAIEFLVVHHGLPDSTYDASCDGTWLQMRCTYTRMAWGSSNDYENSEIHSWLNDTFVSLLDAGVQNVVKQVKIPYRVGSGDQDNVASGANGLSAKSFLLSFREVGFTSTVGSSEGAVLTYYSEDATNRRIAKDLDGGNANWHLRTPWLASGNRVRTVRYNGNSSYAQANELQGIRPAFILPYNVNVADDGFIYGTLASSAAITGTVPINGVQRELTGAGYINIGGVLRPLVDSCANINGVLLSLNGVSKDVSGLPTGYTQVEFISATGTQYIDTGLVANKSDSYEYIISAYFTNAAWGGANAYLQFNSEISTNVLTEFRVVYDGSTYTEKIYVNGSLHTTSSWKNATYTDVKIGILRLGSDGNTWYELEPQIGKVYGCKIYKSGTLVRDFIPCTNPSGVAGLYDLVGGAFYGNAGTGTFGTGA